MKTAPFTNAQIRSIQHQIEESLTLTRSLILKNKDNELIAKRLEHNVRLLRNGFIGETVLSLAQYHLHGHSNTPLSFVEQTSYNAWFLLNPQKIAGVEVETTSRDFPVKVKGTLTDVLRVLKQGIAEKKATIANQAPKPKTLILALAAKAKLKKLQLLKNRK